MMDVSHPSRNLKYILDGHTPVACPEGDEGLLQWARWMESEPGGKDVRRVARTQLEDGTSVSTVFLGLDHNFGMYGPPILFETMIFGNDNLGEYQQRHATWDEAAAGHEVAVNMAKQKENPSD